MSIESFMLLAFIQTVSADNAGDKMKQVINGAKTETIEIGNLIGGAIAACVGFVCGIAALFILIKGGYKSWTNRGVESVFEESGTAMGVLAIVAVIAGIVATIFFTA